MPRPDPQRPRDDVPDQELLGRTVGNWRIQRKLGAGGMGAVYVAVHANLPRKAAIKVLLPHLLEDDGAVERFQKEAQMGSKVSHPNVVEIEDYGHARDIGHYVLMDFLEGRTLSEAIEDEGAMKQARFLDLAEQICAGVAAAHKHLIVHRDLKPDNVFLVADETRPEGEAVRLLDFGIAKDLDADVSKTHAGLIIGTPRYLSPEQARGASNEVDARSDLYSLGVIFYEMCAGAPPFTGDLLSVLRATLERQPPSLAAARPDLDPRIPAVVHRLLEKDRNDRFQGADEVVRALREVRGSVGAAAAPSVKRPVGRPSERVGTVVDEWKVEQLLSARRGLSLYRAHHVALGRKVALRVVDPVPGMPPDAIARLKEALQAVAQIEHPNLLAVEDCGETPQGGVWFTTDLPPGRSIPELVRAQGPAPIPQFLRIAQQLCSGLGDAHRRGLWSASLAANLVLVGDHGLTKDFVKILDVGLPMVEFSGEVTEWGSVLANPRYLAPDTQRGEPHDERSEIYSLGCILYELATGSPPFHDAAGAALLIMAHAQRAPTPPRQLRPDLPAGIEEAILCALAKQKLERPQTTGALWDLIYKARR